MDTTRDLELVLNSGVPIIVIETHDETRLLELLAELAIRSAAADYRALFRWSVTDGLQRVDIDLAPQLHNADPGDVLRHIRAVEKAGIYVMLDFHPYLTDPVNVRLIRDIAANYATISRTLILLSHQVDLPPELEHVSARFDMALPDENERGVIVQRVAEQWARDNPGERVTADAKALELLIKNLAGLTVADTERLARNAIYQDGAITHNDLPAVMQAKYELLNESSVLGYEYETAGFADLGGMRKLKDWLEQRRDAFLQNIANLQLDPPKGVLLLGVQGCGKSLAAKAAAGVYGVPLLRLDFGSLYNKYYGESERNLRESLKTAGVMAPCVLWIDEIEKAIAGDDDGGTSRRVLGTFLTWLAEKQEQVFVVATANDIHSLPPELVRKGRFDEIFFVDLPRADVRREILSIHVERRGLDPGAFDLDALAPRACRGFSGAEIEQAVVSALYTAHALRQDPQAPHILAEIRKTRPLSVVMREPIQALRTWAEHRTVQAD